MLDFRKAGFTDAAIDFPLSDAGCAIVAEHNGIAPDQMPPEWRYAPNAYMQRWLDALGTLKMEGRTVRIEGRWITPIEIYALLAMDASHRHDDRHPDTRTAQP